MTNMRLHVIRNKYIYFVYMNDIVYWGFIPFHSLSRASISMDFPKPAVLGDLYWAMALTV